MPRIIGFDTPMLAIPSDHGGFAQMQFGNITFMPLLFSGDYPPPASCPIEIYYTDTTELARELVFKGTAHLNNFDREQITYSLYGPTYDETVADSTAYNDTLNEVLTTILTTIPEITTVNTTNARVSSPNVTYTTSGVTLAADLASAIAEFYGHLIYVVGTTAYLVDMLLNNGTWTLTEFQFFATPQYWYKPPVSIVYSSTQNVASAYPYGQSLTVTPYHTTGANILTAITDILAIENAARVTLDVPMIAGNFPLPGKKIIIPDTSHVVDLSSWVRARKLRYDFLNNQINIEGEGVVAAA
ncbi:MAG: hypothetical protein WC750_06370 [Patescibacteria group bacterium]